MLKKNVDLENLNETKKAKMGTASEESLAHVSGIAGDILIEAVPTFLQTPSEKVISGKNNTFIVLGRDRPRAKTSGYGGIGHTQAGMIDIVVGRHSANPIDGSYVDPSFKKDAARIYVSQKTDIDANLGIDETSPGRVGNPMGKSALGLKADNLRFVAREGIKLVTGVDSVNSQGGENDAILGIDLIAGNNGKPAKAGEEGVQSIPKGANLLEGIEKVISLLEETQGIVSTFLKSQMDYNTVIGSHFHQSPFFGNPTTPSIQLQAKSVQTQMDQFSTCMADIQKAKANIAKFKGDYLLPTSKKYINSKYNTTN